MKSKPSTTLPFHAPPRETTSVHKAQLESLLQKTSKDPKVTSTFVDSVFADRIEIESWITTNDNYQFIQSKKLAMMPRNKEIAAITQSLTN